MKKTENESYTVRLQLSASLYIRPLSYYNHIYFAIYLV